jgi:hypothetical protein
MRRSAVPFLLAFVAPLAPALAGTVYVPFATHQKVGTVVYKTGVWVSNPSDAPRRFTTAFIASETNGTNRAASGSAVIQPRGSMLLTNVAPQGAHGMLEIDGAPQLVVRARLDAVAAGRIVSSTPVPVISGENWVPAGRAAHLQGLGVPAAGGKAGFGLVNLAAKAAECTVEAFRPNGAPIGRSVKLRAKPVSHRQLQETLAEQGGGTLADARLEVTCNRPFYAYATQLAGDGSQTVFVAPSGRLLELALPGAPSGDEGPDGKPEPPPGKPPVPTPTDPQPPPTPPSGPTTGGAIVSAPGVFLDVRQGDSYRAFELPLQLDARYRKLVVDFDIYLANWQSTWFHGITSLKRNDKTLYYGLLLKGDPTKTIVDLGREQQVKENFPWRQRTTYHVRMIYDLPAKRITAQFFQGGSLVHALAGRMMSNDLRAFGKYRVRVDFGLPGVAHSAYYPPYGSKFSNLTVTAER